MKKSTRHHQILELVREAPPQQVLSTKDLAEQFAVSETTIRRDFQELADAGLIQRQYGGAHSVKPSVQSRLGQVGILLGSRIDKYSDPFYNLVLEGADKKLSELGYHAAYVKTYYDVQSVSQARESLQSFDVDGLILLGSSTDEGIQYFRDNFSPIVTVTDMYEIDDDTILLDGYNGMRQVVNHLADLGYKCPGYVSGQNDFRYHGFLETVKARNLIDDPSLHQIVTPGVAGWIPEVGERGTAILMSQELKPDVIVCASDRLAIGAMQWLHRNGYRVPDDIAVTGFDNIPHSEFTFPPLTTVHVHKMLLGEIAAERVVRRIENPDEIYLKITVPTHLVIRQSCKKQL